MIRIALTGPSGSGKSTLLSLLEEKGCGIIDCDVLVHELQIPGERCYEELVEAFGTGILRSDSGIDRRELAKIAFSSREMTVKLNSITHKHVVRRVDEIANNYENNGCSAVFIEAGALFESGLDKTCDKVILLTANRDTLIKRILERDHIDVESANQRLNIQKDIQFLKSNSDMVLFNEGEQYDLQLFCDLIIKKINYWNWSKEHEKE